LQTQQESQQKDPQDTIRDVIKRIEEQEGREVKSRNAWSIRKESIPNKEKHMKSFKEFLKEACWDGYVAKGTKKKKGRIVPNCVPIKKEK